MLSLQMILDRIRQHGWQMCEVERAVRLFNLPMLADGWREAHWHTLEIVM